MQPTAEHVWASAQQHLRALLNADIYNLWFAPLQAVGFEKEILTLQVANDFCELWLQDNYLGLMRDALAHTSGQPLAVRFQTASSPATTSAAASGQPREKHVDDSPASAPAPAIRETTFDPKNIFDTFVVGSNNNFAHAAA